ncbi:BNR-4 repeat-containing protein [Halosimplex rubrum]|uniref:BNR-4 repeat-containing protein n=1 Tax=Halosimplex rubrum TaxID=869889 RepID=A0A7D5P1T3_9EURY|nr:BNR-4 repeat-containing protein [Halosimplex rubrum]QLH76064.1 BNR-4 repeat-containing protein [Halosimplex rubrum]
MGPDPKAPGTSASSASVTARTITDEAGRKAAHDKQNPQAVYRAERETTYVVFRGDDADPFATEYDHATGEFGPLTRVGRNPIPDDDTHGAPALTVDDDGYLHVFYGVHNDPISYARSARPYETTEWELLGDPVDCDADDVLASPGWDTDRALLSVPGGTYTFPLTYQNDIYVLYRTGTEPNAHGADPKQGGDRTTYPSHEFATILRSTDRGDSWEDLGPVIDTRGARGRPETDAYVEDFDERGGNLHITWTVATGDAESQPPRGHDGPRKGGFHAYYDVSDGELYDLAGNRYTTPITWEDHNRGAVRIANDEHVTESGWVYKHLIANDEVFVVFQSKDNIGNSINHPQHVIATYDDGWQFEPIPGGQTASSHGHIRTDDAGDLEAHLVERNAERGDGANYTRFVRRDGSWERTRVIENEAIEGINTVRDGTDEFAAVANECSGENDEFSERLWGVGSFET